MQLAMYRKSGCILEPDISEKMCPFLAVFEKTIKLWSYLARDSSKINLGQVSVNVETGELFVGSMENP